MTTMTNLIQKTTISRNNNYDDSEIMDDYLIIEENSVINSYRSAENNT